MANQDKEQGQGNSPGGRRLILGAVVGAVVAILVGFSVSMLFSLHGIGLFTPSQDIKSVSDQVLSKSGLNYLAIQHIRIIGQSMPGGEGNIHLSIVWPITLWGIIPAFSLMLGGYAGKLTAGARGTSRFMLSVLIAVFYTLALLVFRPYFSTPSVSAMLPKLEIGGWNAAIDSYAVLLTAAPASTLFHAFLFGIIFAPIGAFGGFKALHRSLLTRDSLWPAWLQAALVSLIILQVVFMFLLAVYAGYMSHRGRLLLPTETTATLLPAGAGITGYLAHGVTLTGAATSSLDIESGFRLRTGLFRGVDFDGKTRPTPSWAYFLLILPAVALIIGGKLAARLSNRSLNPYCLAISFAGAYALLFTAVRPLFAIIQRSEITAAGIRNQAAFTIEPSSAEAFAFSLILAFVFGLVGITLNRRHDHQ